MEEVEITEYPPSAFMAWLARICRECGTKLLHFEDPCRDVCPNERNHNKISIGRRKEKPDD